jgi:hypothetical protein
MTAEVKTYGEGSSMYSVRQTDCRTGWQVLYAGRVVATFRRRESADDMARDLNG